MSRSRTLWLAVCLVFATHFVACTDPGASTGQFDGARAFQHLRALVEIGPRPAGSEGAAAARAYIESALRQAGVKTETMRFALTSPDGRAAEGANVVGTLEGASGKTVVFLTHYDTKARLVEANAAASGAALLLELARVAAADPRSATTVFAFVDASQPVGAEVTETDGLAGSRALALEWDRTGRLSQLGALVLVESVADRDLQLANEAVTRPDDRLLFARIVNDAGLAEKYDLYASIRVRSDQDPFVVRGVTRILTILDPAHGGAVPPGSLRGSDRDDLSSVSEDTLARMGHLSEQLLRELTTPR